MASKETTLAELGAMLTHVVDHMATKDDITGVKDEVAEIKEETADIKSDVVDIRATMATKNDVRLADGPGPSFC